MITIAEGNIIEAEAEALVNTVNCVGFMGKGIALQFKQAFPKNFEAYEKACRSELVQPGKMFIFETCDMFNPRYIVNFPTKRDWRSKSRIADIESGLEALIQEVQRLNISSIAIPPLGCGLGGLKWSEVRPLIEKAFSALPHVKIHLYAPLGAPAAKTMPIRTAKPEMTMTRALLVKLMEKYLEHSYRLTLLEIQKLAYFLQEAGEPLQLRYEAGHYGPYAANLNKVLERIEGHFIRGYGDKQKPDAEIELLPEAIVAANEFLLNENNSPKRLDEIAMMLEGFETPYGVELLSSVHWVARRAAPPATDEDSAIAAIWSWNERKKKVFREAHIRVAWRKLKEHNWLQI